MSIDLPENPDALDIPKSSIYYTSCAPYCIVSGPGPVGQRVKNLLTSLGSAAEFRFIDGSLLTTMPEAEIKFALKSVKTVIIAGDNIPPSKSAGWFDKDEPFSVITEKGFKRLLNLLISEREKTSSPQPVRMINLGKASKDSKGIASMFGGGGDGSELNRDDFTLQCRQRGVGYCAINVGKIIADDANLPEISSTRPLANMLVQLPDANSVSSFGGNPILLTRSRVEPNEGTKVTVAAEALLRAAGYPACNYTVNLLSREVLDKNLRDSSNEEWNDELVKLLGPELERIPLVYSSASQVSLKLQSVGKQFAAPGGGGLVTPVQLSKFSNGMRLEFVPKEDAYK